MLLLTPDALNEAIEFAAKIGDFDDVCALTDEFEGRLETFGLSAFVCSGFLRKGRAPEKDDPLEYDVLVNKLPDGFIESIRREFKETDITSQQLISSNKPFVWSDVWSDLAKRNEDEASDLRESLKTIGSIAYDHNLRDGICVPVHHSGGYVGAVGMAGHSPELPNECRVVLRVLAITYHDRVLELATEDEGMRAKEKRQSVLSPRERECVKWVADGKTDSDMGEILGISPSTAHFHVENAKKKLNVPTRVQLVVKAIRLGEIEL